MTKQASRKAQRPRTTPPLAPAETQDYAEKLLGTFEVIVRDGPASLNEVMEATGYPKASAWRLIKKLEARGWVRVRLSDGKFEASSDLDLMLANGHVAPQEARELGPLIRDLAPDQRLSVFFWVVASFGEITLIDSLRAGPVTREQGSLVDGLAATAALSACTRRDILRHLEMYSRRCDPEEGQQIRSGARLAQLERAARDKGFVRGHDGLSFALPWTYGTGATGAIELHHRGASRADRGRPARLSAQVLEWWAARWPGPDAPRAAVPSLIDEMARIIQP